MPLETLASDLWPLTLLSAMIGIAVFPLALFCSFIYASLSHRFEHVPKPVWFLLVTLLGTLLAVLAAYLYLDATFADVVQAIPTAPTG
ncbi:hypothetical protein HYV43_01160 [Candidatus Micrarchaeota archaeon]|nr:hypothetical protein [Candidatus Micrarchaeota archaeon]